MRFPDDCTIILLDADTWVDPLFIDRTRRELGLSDGGALLPYTDALFADTESSARMRAHGADAGGVLGHLVLHPPGGVVAVRKPLFDKVGGFNEAYIGWGWRRS